MELTWPQIWEWTRYTTTHLAMFLILLWLLKKYLWGPLLKMMDERAEAIRSEFDKADDLQEKAEEIRASYEERLKEIEAEARAKINAAIAEGEKVRAEVVAKAQEETKAIREKSERDVQQQIAKARIELKDEIVKMTLYATGKLIHEELDDEKHRKLVGDFIDKV